MKEREPFRFTLTQLRSFEAVARHGAIGRAAQALNLAQPTVSMQLRELAQALDLTLLEPAGRGVRLTPHGDLLARAARELMERWAQFEEEAAALSGGQSGHLRISAVTTAEYFLPELIGPFAHAHPGVQVELAVENRDAVVQRLARGDDELAVMMLPPTELPLERWPFLENPLVVVASAQHALAGRRRIPLAQILSEPLLAREAGSGTRRAADQMLAAQGLEWRPRMALGSNEAIKHSVAAGLGLAVLSRHALGRDPQRDGLVELSVQGFPIRRMWHFVWRSDRRMSRPATAFLADVRARLARAKIAGRSGSRNDVLQADGVSRAPPRP
ncbi:MAG: LysR family transcriptional regulator [Rubrivivax sp.]|nr:LysR family transcriptional regulator [Rubrivivax sp.]